MQGGGRSKISCPSQAVSYGIASGWPASFGCIDEQREPHILRSEHAELETEIVSPIRKYAKEVQPSKRNAVCKSHKQAKAELSLLKGE